MADTHKLYRMRYVDLPASYFVSYAAALNNAAATPGARARSCPTWARSTALEKPAVMADFLLRLDNVQWSLVTAVHESRLVLSLRTRSKAVSAVDVIRKITREIGTGGGHRLKAGGFVELADQSPAKTSTKRSSAGCCGPWHIRGRQGVSRWCRSRRFSHRC